MAPKNPAIVAGLALSLAFGTIAAPHAAAADDSTPGVASEATDVDKGAFTQQSLAGTMRSVQGIELVNVSDEMKYFTKYESHGNYNQGFSYGDGYNALGYYQFDRRWSLVPFMTQAYNYNSVKYSMLKAAIDRGADIKDADVPMYANGQLTEVGRIAQDAFQGAYAADPAEFAALQDSYAYNSYYAVTETWLKNSLGIDISGRADCVKGMVWSIANMCGTGGCQDFFRWANLSNSMSDREFVTALANSVIDNVARKYPAQSQYHAGWKNRYRNELKDCLVYIAEDEAAAQPSAPGESGESAASGSTAAGVTGSGASGSTSESGASAGGSNAADSDDEGAGGTADDTNGGDSANGSSTSAGSAGSASGTGNGSASSDSNAGDNTGENDAAGDTAGSNNSSTSSGSSDSGSNSSSSGSSSKSDSSSDGASSGSNGQASASQGGANDGGASDSSAGTDGGATSDSSSETPGTAVGDDKSAGELLGEKVGAILTAGLSRGNDDGQPDDAGSDASEQASRSSADGDGASGKSAASGSNSSTDQPQSGDSASNAASAMKTSGDMPHTGDVVIMASLASASLATLGMTAIVSGKNKMKDVSHSEDKIED